MSQANEGSSGDTHVRSAAVAPSSESSHSEEEFRVLLCRYLYERTADHTLRNMRHSTVQDGKREVIMKPRLQIHSPPTSTHVTAEFELPGISDADIVITIESDGKLTVSGERAVPDVWHSGDSYPVREFKYGKFKRVVDIPIGLKSQHITAELQQGILSLKWPHTVPLSPEKGAS